MSGRRDYFYKQKVTEAELDAGFNALEVADRALATDWGFTGVITGTTVVQRAAGANISVDVAAGITYDQLGQRIQVPSTQNVSVANDSAGVTTSVSGGGNEKIVSVFVEFDRALSDPRTDGNGATVYFVRDESYKFHIKQGAEAAAGAAVAPALEASKILLADITRTFGQTQILNANISTSRREDAIVTSFGNYSIRRGRIKDAFTDVITFLNQHVIGAATQHGTDDITNGGVSGTWADATTLAGATLDLVLNDLVADLGGTGGSGKIGHAHTGNWADATSIAGATVKAAIQEIVTDLGATTGDVKVGSPLRSGTNLSLAAGSVGSQLGELRTYVDGLGPKAGANGLASLGATTKVPIAQILNGIRSVNTVNLTAADFSTTSTSLVDVTAITLSLTGCEVGDKIVIIWQGIVYGSGGSAGETQVRIVDGSNVDPTQLKRNSVATSGDFQPGTSHYVHTVANAGTITVKAMAKTSNGANAATVVNNSAVLTAIVIRP